MFVLMNVSLVISNFLCGEFKTSVGDHYKSCANSEVQSHFYFSMEEQIILNS